MSFGAKVLAAVGGVMFVMLIVRAPDTAAGLVLGLWHILEKIGDFLGYVVSKG